MRALPRYFPVYCLFILCFVAGCDEQSAENSGTDHPAYIDSAVKPYINTTADSIRYPKIIDSIYRTVFDPGPADRWDKYFYLFTSATAQHNYTKALAYIDSMFFSLQSREREEKYIERYAKTLFYKGDVLLYQGRNAESFTFYYKAREVIFQKNDPCILSEYSSRLAAATFRQQRFRDAAAYYKQTIRDLEGCPIQNASRFGEIQGTLDNIGIAYLRADMLDSAELYFNKALDYIEKNSYLYTDKREDFVQIANGVIFGNLAGVAIRQKKFDTAEKLLKESIRLNAIPGHAYEDIGYGLVKLTKIYLDQNRIAEAANSLNDLETVTKKYPNNNTLQQELYLLRSKLAGVQGDEKKAYVNLLQYQKLKDYYDDVNDPIISTDMQQAVDNISQQYQLAILAKDNKRKSDYLWWTVIIATMAIAIIVLIWVNYRRYRHNVNTLVSLNDTVNQKNQALLQTLAALEHSHNNNTRLLKVVAHDLRGPLGAIASIAELARDGMLPPEKYQETMAVIYRSGNKALTLANHLLDDMQSSSGLENVEPLNIAEQIGSCVELYEHRIREKDQTVTLKTVPAYVKGEREKLWRAFSNLISNAVKFTRVGGEINISMRIKEEQLIIEFHDNGIGIPDDIKDRIFEPTEATTRSGTIGERSFGFGLSIVKNIVLMHQGELWFISNEKKGTTFFVSLPLAKPDTDTKLLT